MRCARLDSGKGKERLIELRQQNMIIACANSSPQPLVTYAILHIA